MNPIVLNEVINYVIEFDIESIFKNLVDLISLLAAVCVYFVASYDLKN